MKSGTLLFALAGVTLSACASVATGRSQPIEFATLPEDGALCVVESPTGEKWDLTTPASITVRKSKHDLRVRCEKDGRFAGNQVIKSELEPWALGNILFGIYGLVAVGADWATGAIHQYEDQISVIMTPIDPVPVAVPVPASAEPKAGRANAAVTR